ncbi:MAG: hypothetical protein AB7F43_00020 [Bacteriovoracia bacterium]
MKYLIVLLFGLLTFKTDSIASVRSPQKCAELLREAQQGQKRTEITESSPVSFSQDGKAWVGHHGRNEFGVTINGRTSRIFTLDENSSHLNFSTLTPHNLAIASKSGHLLVVEDTVPPINELIGETRSEKNQEVKIHLFSPSGVRIAHTTLKDHEHGISNVYLSEDGMRIGIATNYLGDAVIHDTEVSNELLKKMMKEKLPSIVYVLEYSAIFKEFTPVYQISVLPTSPYEQTSGEAPFVFPDRASLLRVKEKGPEGAELQFHFVKFSDDLPETKIVTVNVGPETATAGHSTSVDGKKIFYVESTEKENGSEENFFVSVDSETSQVKRSHLFQLPSSILFQLSNVVTHDEAVAFLFGRNLYVLHATSGELIFMDELPVVPHDTIGFSMSFDPQGVLSILTNGEKPQMFRYSIPFALKK